MPTDRELMQQALDVMLESKPIDINDPAAFYRSAHAIEALRIRLAQPEQEPVAWSRNLSDWQPDYVDRRFPLYPAPRILCGCGDQIMPDDGAECGNCVAARNAVK